MKPFIKFGLIAASLSLTSAFLYGEEISDTSLTSSLDSSNAVAFFQQSKSSNNRRTQPSTAVTETDWGAFAAAGEAGYRNFRGSATYGANFSSSARIKFVGEYLTQKLHYKFKHHDVNRWSQQYAVGTEFQGILPHSVFQSIELGGVYAHAFSQKLSTIMTAGDIVKRHIAGSDAALSFVGTTLSLWKCAYLSLDFNYDYVNIHRKYQPSKKIRGAGGSASLVQYFGQDFSLTLETELRKPFHYYGAMLNWTPQYNWGTPNVGAFFNYTNGMKGGSKIATGGLQLGICFGGKKKPCLRSYKDNDRCYTRAYCELNQWVSDPAIRIPIVLAHANQSIQSTPSCLAAPTFTLTSMGSPVTSVTVAYDGTSAPITVTQTGSSSGTINVVSADTSIASIVGSSPFATFQIRGETTVTTPPEMTTVTVTDTNSCGSTDQTIIVNVM